ncbi:hypothetical protein AB0K14_13650 [Actinosynnema sp. NPDC050801]
MHREVRNLSGEASGAREVWQQSLAIFDGIGSAEADRIRARLAG